MLSQQNFELPAGIINVNFLYKGYKNITVYNSNDYVIHAGPVSPTPTPASPTPSPTPTPTPTPTPVSPVSPGPLEPESPQ